MIIECAYWHPLKGHGKCDLGLYGGRPSYGTCERCIAAKENTYEFAQELLARARAAHPAGIPRISGCCDRADQD
jgi:hypothetical protein